MKLWTVWFHFHRGDEGLGGIDAPARSVGAGPRAWAEEQRARLVAEGADAWLEEAEEVPDPIRRPRRAERPRP